MLGVPLIAAIALAAAATGGDGTGAALAPYRAALAAPETAEATRREVRRQVRITPPVAFVDGYWVTPVDVSSLLGGPGRERLVGLAFTAHELSAALGVPHAEVLDLPDRVGAGEAAVLLVLIEDREEAVFEYMPPPGTPEGECRFFCGDPATWDFDGDGVPNSRDDDDDDDGVPDAPDAYPYWPAESACPCGVRRYTGFTGKFSTEVTGTVLRARDAIERDGGTVTIPSGFEGELRVVFP